MLRKWGAFTAVNWRDFFQLQWIAIHSQKRIMEIIYDMKSWTMRRGGWKLSDNLEIIPWKLADPDHSHSLSSRWIFSNFTTQSTTREWVEINFLNAQLFHSAFFAMGVSRGKKSRKIHEPWLSPSTQQRLIHVKELMTEVCVNSSAKYAS